jgi:6-phosphogluconolactonase (cycloisomerase 2 family)
MRLTPGAVFTQTNTVPNYVLAFNRGPHGNLTAAGQVATGGDGHPAGNPPLGINFLDSAGSVELAGDGNNRSCLFAVNAGSDTVSSFRVSPHGLTLADQESSGGSRPVSVTSTNHGLAGFVMYVLNSDIGSASIKGFSVSAGCALTAIPGSNRATSSPSSLPAAIRFDHRGAVLAVSERFAPAPPTGTGDIDIFPVDSNGVAGAPVVTTSPQATPYGLDWNNQDLLSVTNEDIPTVGAGSTVSTYTLGSDDTLTPVDTKASPGAACWNLFTNNGKFLYTSNPLGAGASQGTEQAFRVHAGKMTSIATYTTTYNAIDNALSHNSRFLYVLSGQVLLPSGSSAIDEYAINHDGSLTSLGTVPITGNSTAGLAAW